MQTPVDTTSVPRLLTLKDVKANPKVSGKALEDAIGFPLKVNSAFRDAAHNELVAVEPREIGRAHV